MENRNQRLFLALLLSSLTTAALAADEVFLPASDTSPVIEPELQRRSIEKPAIDTENFEIGAYYGLISIEDFDTSDVMGVSVAYHITEDFFFEATYAMAEGDRTSYEELSGGAPLLDSGDRDYTYYNLSVGWNVLPGEVFFGSRAFNSAFYLIAGVGRTEFAGDNWFTVNVGAGYRLLLTDWLAWRIDVRDHLFDRDTFGSDDLTNNLELRTGFTAFF